MTFHQLPGAQGMYNPELEHDACGIGLYANIKGLPTHDIVKKGLEMLCRLDHRAGKGSDGQTGDGAGLMVQIPDVFFRVVCSQWDLPEKGQYGVGMLFFTQDDEERQAIELKINETIIAEGQELIGWRTVPTDKSQLSESARETAPVVRQVFIKAKDFQD